MKYLYDVCVFAQLFVYIYVVDISEPRLPWTVSTRLQAEHGLAMSDDTCAALELDGWSMLDCSN